MQLVILKGEEEHSPDILHFQTKSKGKENVFFGLSTSRPLHGETIDDGKEKPQIIKFYDFTKVGKWI